MKRFVMALALTCALFGVALAGEMPIGGIAPPPPPVGSEQTNITTTIVLALISALSR